MTGGVASAERLPYLPSIDGLRAVSVLAVLLFHADVPWASGGFFGVEVFFVVSGYLITCLLLAEYELSGGVDLKEFWLRRARRLLPALYVVMLSSAAFALAFVPDAAFKVRRDFLPAVFYVSNWWLVFSQEPYFAQIARPSLFKHLWSLAIEEQFYLIWPVLFIVGMRYMPAYYRPTLIGLTLPAVYASALQMMRLSTVSTDRAYYGTDTRASGLLLGASLAFVWRPWRQEHRDSPTASAAAGVGWFADGCGLVCIAVLLSLFVHAEYDGDLFRWGFVAVDVLSVAVIAATVHPGARLITRLLSVTPLVWIGQRSYGLYLFHFPVYMVTREEQDVRLGGTSLLAFRLCISFVLAAWSYHFVERPVRDGSFVAWLSAASRRTRVMLMAFAFAVLVVLAVGLAGAVAPGSEVAGIFAFDYTNNSRVGLRPEWWRPWTPVSQPGPFPGVRKFFQVQINRTMQLEDCKYLAILPKPGSLAACQAACLNTTECNVVQHRDNRFCRTADCLDPGTPVTWPSRDRNAVDVYGIITSTPRQTVYQITGGGDSVPFSAHKSLRRLMPGFDDRAVVAGQHFTPMLETWRKIKAEGTMADTLFLHVLHDNAGYKFSQAGLDALMDVIGDRRLLIMDDGNKGEKLFRDLYDRPHLYPNVKIVYWRRYAFNYTHWFMPDHYHISPAGGPFYAQFVKDALFAHFPPKTFVD